MTKKGFTIVELLIYMGLLAVFIVVLSQIFGSIIDTQLESTSSSAVDQDGRYILARLAYDIHRATAVTTPSSNGSTTANLGLTISGATYSYQLANSQLALASPQGSDMLHSFQSTVSDLSFTRLGNTTGPVSVQVNFTLTSVPTTLDQQSETRSYQTSVSLRSP